MRCAGIICGGFENSMVMCMYFISGCIFIRVRAFLYVACAV